VDIPLKVVKCPKCGVTLEEVPAGWDVSVRVLAARERSTGQGSVKHCFGRICKGKTWVEIVRSPRGA
jgi:hypothetical protein